MAPLFFESPILTNKLSGIFQELNAIRAHFGRLFHTSCIIVSFALHYIWILH